MRSGYQPDSMSVGSVHEHVPMRSLGLEAIGFLSVESGVELLGLRASLREHHHQYPEKHGEPDEPRDLPASARHERERAEESGHQVDQEDGLLVREPDVEKPMVEVAAVRRERRLSREDPADEHVEGVDDRDAEHEERGRDLGGPEDREDREHRPEEHDAGGAKKQTRGMEVEEQETRDRAGERETHPRDERLGDLREKREPSEGERSDRGDTGGETVQAVDEVERVIHPDDPQHREGDRDGERQLDQAIGQRVIHEIDVNTRENDHRGDDDLTEELPTSAELQQIVDEPDRHPEQRGDRGQRESRRANLLRNEEGMSREPVDEPEDKDRRPERDRDRETARARDGTRMAPASPGHVEHSEVTSGKADQWSRDRSQRERKQR